jgi:hypothetical protein
MTYYISLQLISIVIGLLLVAVHLPGVLWPVTFSKVIRAFPRHYPLGIALTVAAGTWFTLLTALTDLGELSPYRTVLVMLWVSGTALTVIFVPVFLAVRGLAMVMLLAVAVILDAAFPLDTPWRLVMVILAYVWAVVGIILVCSPYLMRDSLAYALKTVERCRWFCWPGVAAGAVMIVLGIFVY